MCCDIDSCEAEVAADGRTARSGQKSLKTQQKLQLAQKNMLLKTGMFQKMAVQRFLTLHLILIHRLKKTLRFMLIGLLQNCIVYQLQQILSMVL